MLAAVVYLTLGSLLASVIKDIRLKVYVIVIAVMLTIAVGVGRVYLGVHYPTDVDICEHLRKLRQKSPPSTS